MIAVAELIQWSKALAKMILCSQLYLLSLRTEEFASINGMCKLCVVAQHMHMNTEDVGRGDMLPWQLFCDMQE